MSLDNTNLKPRSTAIESEMHQFQGTWRQIECEADGVKNPAEDYGANPISTFAGDTFVVRRTDGSIVIKGTFVIDPTQEPKTIDWTDTFGADAGKTFPAIYTRDGEQLIFCAADEGQARPAEFRSRQGQVLRVLQRVSNPVMPRPVDPVDPVEKDA